MAPKKGKQKQMPNAWEDAAGCSRTVRRLAQEVNRLKTHFNTEEKWAILAGSATVTNSFVTTSMNVLPQGLDDGERVGDSVKMFKIVGRFTLKVNAASTLPQFVTLAIVMKKSTNGASCDPAEIWQNQGTPQIRNKAYLSNYSILAMKHFTLVPGADSACQIWEIEIPLNTHVTFSADTAAVTDLSQNLVQLLKVSDQSSNQPTCVFKTVVQYVDD